AGVAAALPAGRARAAARAATVVGPVRHAGPPAARAPGGPAAGAASRAVRGAVRGAGARGRAARGGMAVAGRDDPRRRSAPAARTAPARAFAWVFAWVFVRGGLVFGVAGDAAGHRRVQDAARPEPRVPAAGPRVSAVESGGSRTAGAGLRAAGAAARAAGGSAAAPGAGAGAPASAARTARGVRAADRRGVRDQVPVRRRRHRAGGDRGAAARQVV